VTASHPATQPASHVAVAITLNAKASSLKSSVDVDSKQLVKTICYFLIKTRHTDAVGLTTVQVYHLVKAKCHQSSRSKVWSKIRVFDQAFVLLDRVCDLLTTSSQLFVSKTWSKAC